jgi:RimJ/RimL family protein N-acetyltransferase
MTVRRLTIPDAAAWRVLMIDGYTQHPDAFTTSAHERAGLPVSWWAARLAPDAPAGEVLFGAFGDETLAGVAGLSFERREKAQHKALLFGMHVAADFRGRGMGRELVEAVVTHARGLPQLRVVQLTVSQGNHAAEALYTRCGFAPFGVEPFAVAVGGTFVSKIHMWLDLRTPRRE